MDRELLEKEVLCILDTRKIQQFIFQTGSQFDSIGASDLLRHVLGDAILFALRHVDPAVPETDYDLTLDADADLPWFTDPGIVFQLITCSSGNAMFLARTGALAGKIIRKISRYYLEHGYSLNLTAACVEKTDSMEADISCLYQKLDKCKASSTTQEPLGTLPVCIREAETGYPVLGYDEILSDPISEATRLRREEAGKRALLVRKEEIHTTTAFDQKSYMAVIHADGNNIGITIGTILRKAEDYETGIRTRRRISRDLESTIAGAVHRTMQDLENYYRKITGKTEDFEKEFVILHRAGDDINCMCNAIWAFPFLEFLHRNLKDAYICRTDSMEVPFHFCGGIAFVTKETSFERAFSLAQECCSNAKMTARMKCNLRNGLAGTWIDYQVLDTPDSQDLEMLRKLSYVNSGQVSFLLRPYCMDPEAADQEYAYGKLMNRAGVIKSLHLNRTLESVLRHSYLIEREEFHSFLAMMKREGIDLIDLLGKPIYRDINRKPHGTWFDAAEAADFIPGGADR